MSEFVLINDVHLSDRPPASCTDTYLDDLFDLLKQAVELAEPRRAAIVLAGDVFHHKVPGRTSHSTVMRLIEWARSTTVPVYAVAGNHDLAHDRVGSLDETQPLGVALASGAIQLLDGWIKNRNEAVFGVPWQMTFDDANVRDALSGYRKYSIDVPQHIAHFLVVTHAPLYPPGKELKYENYPAADWAEAMGNVGTVHYGHVHEPHGIYQVDGVTFSNCGALSRGSLHEHNLTRTPAVAIWKSDTGEITHHQLDAKPADQVFRLQEVAETRAEALNLSSFLDSVRQTRLEETSIFSVMDHVQATQEDDALITVIRGLLEQADAQ